MPIPLGLISAGASLVGGALSGWGRRGNQPDFGRIGNQYLGQFGAGIRDQFGQNYNSGPLAGLTMGAGNAYDYANIAGSRFKQSPAYSAMMANLGNAANSTSQAFQQRLGGGLNTGVGQGLSALGNTNTMFNMGLMNANLQNYMNAQQQFLPLAGMRQQGAMDLTRGTIGMANQAMSQYSQAPSMMESIGGGLMGLGNAGMNYAMMGRMGGMGGGNPSMSYWGPQMQQNYWDMQGGWNNPNVRPR